MYVMIVMFIMKIMITFILSLSLSTLFNAEMWTIGVPESADVVD